MDSRERLLTALNNQRPDHLPAQVHNWMRYYLDTYLDGCDAYAAYDRFGLDFAIYVNPEPVFDERDLANWQVARHDLGVDHDGNTRWLEVITTPGGELRHERAANVFTTWTTEYLIHSEPDFELFDRYVPVPIAADVTPVTEALNRVGRRGIVRGHAWGFGQGSPWQDFCTLVDTQRAILWGMDEPDFVAHAMQSILQKRLRYVELLADVPLDLIEVGGGAGSNTVISPKFFRRCCLPYDKVQNAALHDAGKRVVYHLCGGLMQMLDLVVESGADGLETMTPSSMGGDCDLAEARRRAGGSLFFVGGLDQNRCFENDDVCAVRAEVQRLHRACPDGGYICSPSDHFFAGDPTNLQAFADAAKECTYD